MSKFLESQQPNCNSTASDGTSSEDKSGEISFASRTCARSTGASSQPPAKRAKSAASFQMPCSLLPALPQYLRICELLIYEDPFACSNSPNQMQLEDL
ncbi:hypothetical protein SprV_0100436800 [Sparganum proliferum]